jgi:GAF domain-containing protein
MTEMLHSTRDLGGGPLGAWLQALPHPVIQLDTDGCILGTNLPAAQLLGITSDALQGQPFATTALPEPAQGGFLDVFRHVMEGRSWGGALPLTTAPEAHLHVAPVEQGGTVIGALVTIESVGRERARTAQVGERLNRLARVATELQAAGNLERLTNIVVSHMADAAGATTASLSVMVDDETFGLLGLRGGTEGAQSRYATYPADDSTPAGVAVRTGRPLLLAGLAAIRSQFPDIELAAPGERSLLCLPLTIEARRIGVMTLSFPGVLDADEAELEFYQIMADSCAQALERIRAVETVAQQHAKLTFLAKASAELASSLDYESTLRSVAELAVPDLADWCAISLAQDGVLRTLAVAHRDPAKVQLALDFQQRYPSDPDAETGGYQVLRTGESLLVPEVTDEMLVQGAKNEEHLAMLRDLALYSGLTVPLKAEGRVLGTISWVNGETGRRFSEDDIPFLEDLARRAGIAIDNALLHSELREVADRLQEAVRPAALPELPGWQLGATYTSAGRASVGGDFYDVIPLSDGRVALAIGDVMGRGVTAAAAMSQIRSALRALVAVDPDPRTVMTRLDLLYERFPSDQLVTLLYALADPDLDQIVMSFAGHPSPIVVRADGTADFVPAPEGTLLGVGASTRQAVAVPFLPGETLFMFTDGLLERRHEDLQESEARLLATYRSLLPEPTSDDLCRLVELMRDPSRDDDVAVLAARRLSDASG